MTLPFQEARTLADDARAHAVAIGKALSIAVADYGGFVVLVERMDGARPMTPSIALSKAYPRPSCSGRPTCWRTGGTPTRCSSPRSAGWASTPSSRPRAVTR
jgi:uncharacterized protein GlcG (DUF336 family)